MRNAWLVRTECTHQLFKDKGTARRVARIFGVEVNRVRVPHLRAMRSSWAEKNRGGGRFHYFEIGVGPRSYETWGDWARRCALSGGR